MSELPYGSWPSELHADALARAEVRLGFYFSRFDSGASYFSAPDPADGGRVRLFRKAGDAEAMELLPGRYVRSGINEYGGGDWSVSGDVVVYSDWPSGDLRMLRDGVDLLLAAGGDFRYGSLEISREFGVALAVREDHSGSGEPVNTVVSVPLDGSGNVAVLASGADFYASPTLSADGRLARVQWDHPNMPWDETSVVITTSDTGTSTTVVASGCSNVFPCWADDGALVYLSDRSGWWNLYRHTAGGDQALCPMDVDFCGPMWNPHPAPFALVSDRSIGCFWFEDGFVRLGRLDFDPETGASELIKIKTDAVAVGNTMCGRGRFATARFGYADRPEEYVRIDWETGEQETVFSSGTNVLAKEDISVAEPIRFDGRAGEAHAWYYPPRNSRCAAPDGELPPVIVTSHGGPTSFADPAYSTSVQYWTTRGIAVLDVNYSGSTGYGRAYRERLHGNWGLIDVSDCEDAVAALVRRGLADPSRVCIKGGSAGGYTTLRALTTSTAFTAGITSYGIGDLESMVTDTHKFESRYFDALVAPYPERRDVYRDRSPIHHLDDLYCPVLIFQGTDDRVVPKEQAIALAAALEAKGIPAALFIFEGEGHGFRKAENIQAVLEHSLAFLGKTFGFTPDDNLPALILDDRNIVPFGPTANVESKDNISLVVSQPSIRDSDTEKVVVS
jgi:dipeptidyl aminopeptidase/acylaminoacyl peptidase